MPITTPSLLGVQIEELHTVAQRNLGQYVDVDNTRFVYVRATGTRVQYDLCVIDRNFNLGAPIDLTLDNSPQKLGVPQITGFTLTTPFGWVAIRGNLLINALASCGADTELYTSATPGKVGDSAAGTAIIPGLKLNVANGASVGPVAAIAFSELNVAGS